MTTMTATTTRKRLKVSHSTVVLLSHNRKVETRPLCIRFVVQYVRERGSHSPADFNGINFVFQLKKPQMTSPFPAPEIAGSLRSIFEIYLQSLAIGVKTVAHSFSAKRSLRSDVLDCAVLCAMVRFPWEAIGWIERRLRSPVSAFPPPLPGATYYARFYLLLEKRRSSSKRIETAVVVAAAACTNVTRIAFLIRAKP